MAKIKKAHHDVDSLDLMLDTICNIFGGIIFITMLVVILTTFTSSVIKFQTQDDRKALESVRQDVELQTLTQQVQALRESVTTADALDTLEPDPSQIKEESLRLAAQKRIQERLQREQQARKEAQAAIENIETSRQDVKNRIAQYEEWLKTYKSKVTGSQKVLEQQIQGKSAQIKQLEFELADYNSSRQLQGRLPLEQVSRKAQMTIILRYNRLYVVAEYLPFHLRKPFEGQVVVTPAANNKYQAETLEQRGLLIPEMEFPGDFKQLLSQCPPSQCTISIMVYPDSIKAYRTIRTLALAAGYQYQLWLVTEPGPVTYVVSDKATVQ
jgi:hypothetical protein